MLDNIKKIHFVGIGGIGMSSIAAILLQRGFSVSGSDIKLNRLTEELGRRGARVSVGHNESNIPKGTELVVYSTSINDNNPEITRAVREDITIVHRSDIVAALVNSKKGIAVTGAHGKTTTTSMSALLLTKAGLDPTVIVGGETDFLNGNWRNGKGEFVVCEADESDGTFRKLRPFYAIVTNIDREHLEHYKDFEDLIMANKVFIENIKPGGCLIASHDDKNIKRLLMDHKGQYFTYSVSDARADIYAGNIRMEKFHSSFDVIFRKKDLGRFEIAVPGRHNVENSLAVILLGLQLGLDTDKIRAALKEYRGALRRFEVKAEFDDIMIVEDYAHHPREIAATIAACKNWPGRRLVGVFQPHRYSRTKFLKEEFGKSFLGLDELILTDIYSASEKPIEGVTTKVIYDEALKNGQRKISLLKKEAIIPHLLKTLKGNEIVLILGAGDIGELSDELVKELGAKRQGAAERAVI